jgi:hypothetical protein
MKKWVVIVLGALIICIAFMPVINGNFGKKFSDKDLVEITIDFCGIANIREQNIQLSKQEVDDLDVLFNDIKLKLENVNGNQEIVEIFNNAVLSLNDFGLLPSDMSVEEVQKLVTNSFRETVTLNERFTNYQLDNNNNENFNCYIFGKTSWTTFYKPKWDGEFIYFRNLKLFLISLYGEISFGIEHWDWNGGSGDHYKEPAVGWVWTNGTNGVKTWSGDSLWGNLVVDHFEYSSFGGVYYIEEDFFRGVTGFTGIRIRGFLIAPNRFFGRASHVSIVTEFPG